MVTGKPRNQVRRLVEMLRILLADDFGVRRQTLIVTHVVNVGGFGGVLQRE